MRTNEDGYGTGLNMGLAQDCPLGSPAVKHLATGCPQTEA